MFIRAIFVILLILSTVQIAVACSIPTMPWVSFDSSQYVVTGEVIGYVRSDKPVRLSKDDMMKHGEAMEPTGGVVIRTKEVLYSPRPASKTYEVYRFALGAGCELLDFGLDYFKERYPIGKTVQVYAGDALHLPKSPRTDTARLEVRYGRNDAISLVETSDKTVRGTLDGPGFDYQQYRQDLIGDPYFELLKDAYRLELAKTEAERNPILERLTYYPASSFALHELFTRNSRSSVEFARWEQLVRKREMTKEEVENLRRRVSEKLRSKQ